MLQDVTRCYKEIQIMLQDISRYNMYSYIFMYVYIYIQLSWQRNQSHFIHAANEHCNMFLNRL